MSEPLEIATLGGLRIRLGGEVLADLGSRKAEALLVYLAHSRRPQPREVLAELFWDERATAQALNNLRWLLSRLGSQLSPYLSVTRTTAAIKPESKPWLDVAEFEQALATARAGRTRGDRLAPAAVRDLEQAVALYSGPFLQGFFLRGSSGFEDWMLGEQNRLQRLAAAALNDLTTFYLERGEHATGIGHATRLLQLDPLHEATHRHLMLMLAASGQRRAALEQYETCRRTLATELGATPDAATTELYERIRTGAYVEGEQVAARPVEEKARLSRPQRLPYPLTPFIGRETELAELAAFLADPHCPLVTLVGPGGSGKTRLALEIASQAADSGHSALHAPHSAFNDGIYFVPLAQVSAPEYLVPAIADSLQYTFAGSQRTQDQLFSHLRDKQLLLILDNFEHLTAAADLLPSMLQAAPGIKVIVTSREPLNLLAEQLFDVAGLPVPVASSELRVASDSDQFATRNSLLATLESYSSIQLFAQRALRVQTRFSLSSEVAPWVARICRAVEGLPLGIELAAVLVRERSCQEIAQELERSIDVLATSQRDVPARHRSLRAVFDQSWDLLGEDEQRVLRRVSVFVGGFDLEAATEVAQANRALLISLVQRSLLRQSPAGRFEMHDLLRQYAEERLAKSTAEKAQVVARHARYFMELAETSFTELVGPQQVEWSNRIEREHNNLRAALARSMEAGSELSKTDVALRMAVGLQRFWYFRGYLAEGRRWFAPVLELPAPEVESVAGVAMRGPDPHDFLRAKALNAISILSREQGDYEAAMLAVEESVELLRTLGYQHMLAGPLNNLGLNARDLGDYARAEALMTEALQLNREKGNPQDMALQLNNLGKLALMRGNLGKARNLLEESLAIFRDLKEGRGTALALTNLGQVARNEGDYPQAIASFVESLALYRDVGDRRGITDCLEGLAVAYAAGDNPALLAHAATIYGSAAALREATGAHMHPSDQEYLDRAVSSLRERLGDAAWEVSQAQGRAMTAEQATSFALNR